MLDFQQTEIPELNIVALLRTVSIIICKINILA